MNPASAPAGAATALAPWQLEMYVGAEADGEATPEQLAVLEADKPAWRSTLSRLLRDAEEHLASARTLKGEERAQVVADLESEHRRLAAAWKRLTVGPEPAARELDDDPDDDNEVLAPGRVQLQVSWEPGRVVAWAAGPGTPLAAADEVSEMLSRAVRPRRDGLLTRRCRCPVSRAMPKRSGSPWARCSAGSSRRARTKPETTSLPAFAGWVGSRSGRSSSPRAARWFRCCGNASGEWQLQRVERVVLGALDARADRTGAPRGDGLGDAAGRARAGSEGRRPRAHPFGAHRHGRRDLPRQRAPARSTGAAAAHPHRHRRRRGLPRPARRQRVRRADPARRRDLGPGRTLGPFGHGRARAPGRAARSARRGRRVAARGARSRTRRRARAHRAGDRRRRFRTARHRGRDRSARTAVARVDASGRHATGPGRAQPGRGVGADDRHRRAAARRGIRRARAGALAAQAVGFASRVRGNGVDLGRRREPTRRRAVVGALRRRRAHGRRHRAVGEGSAAAHSLRWALGRGRSRRPQRSGRRARRAFEEDPALRRRDAPARARSRRLDPRRRDLGRRQRVGRRSARSRVEALVGVGGRARRFRRRAAQLPGRGARVARLPRLGRARRLPRARHGSREDADDAGPAPRRRRHRPGARDRAAGRRRQLDRGGAPVHARPARRRAPRRESRRPTRSRPRLPTPTWSSRPTAPRCATSTRSQPCSGIA